MALFLGLSPLFIYSLITYGMRKWRLGLTGTRLIVGKWASPYLSLLHDDTLWCISACYDIFCQCTALTGGLFRVTSGLKPTIGGMVLGTLLRYIYVSTCDHTAWEGASRELVLPPHRPYTAFYIWSWSPWCHPWHCKTATDDLGRSLFHL